jgi:hypothetical protein
MTPKQHFRVQFLRYPGTIGIGIYIRKGSGWRTRYIFASFCRRPIGFVGWRTR